MNLHVYKALRVRWKNESEEKAKGLPSNEDVQRLRGKLRGELTEKYRKNRSARKKAQKMKLDVSVDYAQPKAGIVIKPKASDILALAKQARNNREG